MGKGGEGVKKRKKGIIYSNKYTPANVIVGRPRGIEVKGVGGDKRKKGKGGGEEGRENLNNTTDL